MIWRRSSSAFPAETVPESPPAMAAIWRRVVGMGGSIRLNPPLVSGLFLVACLVLATLAGPLILPDPQVMTSDVLAAPSLGHWLGTDSIGRDVLARLIVGMGASLTISLSAMAMAMVAGIAMGMSAGYCGGWIEWLEMRLIDIVMSVPPLLVAIAVLAAVGPSTPALTAVLAVTAIPQTVRIVRAAAIQLRGKDFVDSARISGLKPLAIMCLHIFPNMRGLLIVQATLTIAHMLLVEATLSFLGLGVQPPAPSLGFMISEGRQWMEFAPWVVVAPGTAILLIVTSFTILGQGFDRAWAQRD